MEYLLYICRVIQYRVTLILKIMESYSVYLKLSENENVCVMKAVSSTKAYYYCAELNKKQPESYFFTIDK